MGHPYRDRLALGSVRHVEHTHGIGVLEGDAEQGVPALATARAFVVVEVASLKKAPRIPRLPAPPARPVIELRRERIDDRAVSRVGRVRRGQIHHGAAG